MHPQYTAAILDQFWASVNRDGPVPTSRPDLGSCWEWTASTLRGGYGQFRHAGLDGASAHRHAWNLADGALAPRRLVVGHTCDNPACVRNDSDGTYTVRGAVLPRRGHLFLGTAADNSRDMADKGRAAYQLHPASALRGDRHWARRHPERVMRGSTHPSAKLTDAQIAEILTRYRKGVHGCGAMVLAREYGVSDQTILRVVNGHRFYTRVEIMRP